MKKVTKDEQARIFMTFKSATRAISKLTPTGRDRVVGAIICLWGNIAQRMAKDMYVAVCEECADAQPFFKGSWPEGWIQVGRSRFGKLYQKSGIGWRCPKHKERS